VLSRKSSPPRMLILLESTVFGARSRKVQQDLKFSPGDGVIDGRCGQVTAGSHVGHRQEEEAAVAPQAPPRLLLSPGEAARALGVSRTKLYELLSSGAIASVLICSLRRVRYAELVAYVEGLVLASPPRTPRR